MTAGVLPSVTLVAIAKNEGPYILEWLSYHLAIGVSHIVVYDNESTDGMSDTLMRIARRSERIDHIHWPSARLHINDSPQTKAYNHAIPSIWTDWVMFLDIDEYMVPFRDGSLPAFLGRVPPEAGSVHVNWRGFGSSGLVSPDYGFVTTSFTRCAHALWGNNHHFKSMARTRLVDRVTIHNIETREGIRVLSDLEPFETDGGGRSNRIVHDGIQINHYQCKTYEEFRRRMNRGDANYHPSHPLRSRDDTFVRFGHLDLNDYEDIAITAFRERHRAAHAALERLL